ncbi:hypothetical protein GCM10027047_21070 [Rhodococcus aerolatus]
MPSSDPTNSVELLMTHIDDVLVPLGFSRCQGDVSDGSGQMLWCSAADEFADRFPSLPVSETPPGGWGTMCTDVSVRVGDGGRVIRVDVEGHDLDTLLAGSGLTTGAARAATLIGSSVTDCGALPSLIRELLDGSSAQR